MENKIERLKYYINLVLVIAACGVLIWLIPNLIHNVHQQVHLTLTSAKLQNDLREINNKIMLAQLSPSSEVPISTAEINPTDLPVPEAASQTEFGSGASAGEMTSPAIPPTTSEGAMSENRYTENPTTLSQKPVTQSTHESTVKKHKHQEENQQNSTAQTIVALQLEEQKRQEEYQQIKSKINWLPPALQTVTIPIIGFILKQTASHIKIMYRPAWLKKLIRMINKTKIFKID